MNKDMDTNDFEALWTILITKYFCLVFWWLNIKMEISRGHIIE